MTTINPHDIPPFSVLDAKTANWKRRKRYWKGLGIRSGTGRDNGLLHREADDESDFLSKRMNRYNAATSIFDPVLTEIAYNWFTAPDWHILDPFAGGSVRGIVAAKMNRAYTGVELRPEQVEANKSQLHIVDDCEHKPDWIESDAMNVQELAPKEYDFIFTCPPYGNLEVYSDDDADLSNMGADDFGNAYRTIIERSTAMLKPNRFACIVVGNYRDKKGFLVPFVAETIDAFRDCGMPLYNEAVYLQPLGTAPYRANRSMYSSRKLVSVHQQCLVFVKGDALSAAKGLNGSVRFYEPVGDGRFRNALKKLQRRGFCPDKESALVELGLTISTIKKERDELEAFLLRSGVQRVEVRYRYRSGNLSTPQPFFVVDKKALISGLKKAGYRDIRVV